MKNKLHATAIHRAADLQWRALLRSPESLIYTGRGPHHAQAYRARCRAFAVTVLTDFNNATTAMTGRPLHERFRLAMVLLHQVAPIDSPSRRCYELTASFLLNDDELRDCFLGPAIMKNYNNSSRLPGYAIGVNDPQSHNGFGIQCSAEVFSTLAVLVADRAGFDEARRLFQIVSKHAGRGVELPTQFAREGFSKNQLETYVSDCLLKHLKVRYPGTEII